MIIQYLAKFNVNWNIVRDPAPGALCCFHMSSISQAANPRARLNTETDNPNDVVN